MHDRAAAAPPPTRLNAPSAATPRDPWRGERRLAQLLLAAGLVLRGLLVLHHRVNSDEPQHLHVAWGWIHGLLPYRDIFDNHTPLFSLLMAPVLALAGERADIIPIMRLAMLPLVAGGLVATWFIARRLFSSRVAWWAVAVAAVNPEFVRASVEYRADQLWWPLWLTTVAVMVCGRPGRWRAFGGGLLLGATIATSMKTSLLGTTLIVTTLLALVPLARRRALPPARHALGGVALVVAGALVVPAALALYFAAQGAWRPLLYGVVWHNVVPQLGQWRNGPFRPLLLVAAVPALLLIGRAILRHTGDPRLGAQRAALFMGTGLAHACFEALWPLLTRQDLLPLVPAYAVFAAALLVEFAEASRRHGPRARAWARLLAWAPALAVVVEMALAVHAESPLRDATREQRALLEQVMRLTRPDDVVMDAKGETIFRRRPYFLGIETITEERFRLGILPDDIADHLVAQRIGVCVRQGAVRFPPRASTFMDTAYVPVGGVVRVLGKVLEPAPGAPGAVRDFHLAIPQTYAAFTAAGPARGALDGTPYRAPRALDAGAHVYAPAPGEGRVAVLWAVAAERGAMPLALRASARGPARAGAVPDTLSVTPADRLLVLSPHPDDESLATGGLIQTAVEAGAAVRVLYMTDGDLNPWSQFVHEHRWPRTPADRERWGALRRGEAAAALHELGVERPATRWLGLPDQGITELLVDGDRWVSDSLAAEIRRWRPTLIAAPSMVDVHPDHNAIAVELAFALARPGVDRTGVRVLSYRVHDRADAPPPERYVTLDGSQMERKRVAIEHHRSQLHWHPREMFQFARPREGYDLDESSAPPRESNLVSEADVSDGALRMTFVRGHAYGLGPLVLRVALQDGAGDAERISLLLPARPGALEATETVSGRALGAARLERAGDAWRLTLPLTGLATPRLGFVKLDHPGERRFGIFDVCGWRAVRAAGAAEPR